MPRIKTQMQHETYALPRVMVQIATVVASTAGLLGGIQTKATAVATGAAAIFCDPTTRRSQYEVPQPFAHPY